MGLDAMILVFRMLAETIEKTEIFLSSLTELEKIEMNQNHLPAVTGLVRGKPGLGSSTHHLSHCPAVQVSCQPLLSPVSPRPWAALIKGHRCLPWDVKCVALIQASWSPLPYAENKRGQPGKWAKIWEEV